MAEKRRTHKSHSAKKNEGGERNVLFGMSVALVLTLFITGCLIGVILTRDTSAEGTPQVVIDSVDLVRSPTTSETSDTMYVTVYIDITNTGKIDVETVLVKLTVEETDSSLALSLDKEMIKNLRARTTMDVEIPIELPKDNENYNIKIKLYVNSMLMVKGQSLVKMGLENKITGTGFTTTQDRSDSDVADDDDEEGNSGFLSPGSEDDKAAAATGVGFVGLIFMVVIIIIAILIVVAIRKARNSGENENTPTKPHQGDERNSYP